MRRSIGMTIFLVAACGGSSGGAAPDAGRSNPDARPPSRDADAANEAATSGDGSSSDDARPDGSPPDAARPTGPPADLDPSFGDAGFVLDNLQGIDGNAVFGLAIDAADRIVAVGGSCLDRGVGANTNNNCSEAFAVARYLPDGSRDRSFSVDGIEIFDFGGRWERANGVAILPDGRIVVAGVSVGDNSSRGLLVGLRPDGSLDPVFGAVALDEIVRFTTVAVQPDGNVVAVGTTLDNHLAVARRSSDGEPDPTFGAAGVVHVDAIVGGSSDSGMSSHDVDLALAPDGGIVVVGSAWDTEGGRAEQQFALARLTTGGVLDVVFGDGGLLFTTVADSPYPVKQGRGSQIAVLPDGAIVVGGEAARRSTVDGLERVDLAFVVARYDATGHLDETFGERGVAHSAPIPLPGGAVNGIGDLAITATGDILLVGQARSADRVPGDVVAQELAVLRFDPNGDLDPQFDGDGVRLLRFPDPFFLGREPIGGVVPVMAAHTAFAVVLQRDGRIVIGGTGFYNVHEQTDPHFGLLRLFGE